jgi:glycosyltransferase involved in cell wall biosynthesis
MVTSPFPISVTIIAKDEADRIAKPILSVRDWVAEVIVVDSGSTDDTVKVAESLGARVMFNAWQGYGQQKIFAEQQAQQHWILNLDADEEVTPELAQNIRALFAGNVEAHSAYTLPWKMLFVGEKAPARFAPVYRFIRLYDMRKAGFRDSTVHDSVVVREGSVGKVNGLVLHRCFRDLHHWTHKINFYSTMQADDFIAKGRKPSNFRIITEPLVSFLKSYILRRYFLYGLDGFVASVQYGYARMLRLAKAREKIRLQKLSG